MNKRYSGWVGLLTATALIVGINGQAGAASSFEQLLAQAKLEMKQAGGKIRMALDWPKRDTKHVLPAFKKAFPFVKEITYKRERGIGPFGRFLIQIKQGSFPPYDIFHVASEFQKPYWEAGAFVKPPFDYNAINASLPAGWTKIHKAALDPNGNFLSTTGNARGNAWNSKLVPAGEEPLTWADCLKPKWRGKVLLDSRNKLQAFQYDKKERPRHIAWVKALVKNDAVIMQGQGTILRKVAAGEYPLACGVNYHTANRMIDRGVKNLKFAIAETVPLEIGTRVYVAKWSKMPATTQLFAVWLATEGQEALDRYAYRGFPWNPKSMKYAQSKGKYIALCGADCARHWGAFNREYHELLGIPVVKSKKKKK